MQYSVLHLRNAPSLWYKIHVFIYELHNFQDKEPSTRLNSIVDPSYISMPYFRPEEAAMLKATIVQGSDTKTMEELIQETLEERFERRMQKRVESGDYRSCAAHDIAPIFEKGLGIKWKELAKDKEFLELRGSSGLKLKDGETWNGLRTKPFAAQPPNQKNKRGRR